MFPQVIIQKKILPAIAKDPNYLSTHNMEWNEGTSKNLVSKLLRIGDFYSTLTLFTCMTRHQISFFSEKKSL
jgi:hypothetical protein